MIGRGESLPVAPSIALPRSLRVSRFTLVRVLWRSFFFQAATNYERMQNVGFAYSMIPALTELYRGEDLKRAMARHLLFFNSHPYMADALLEHLRVLHHPDAAWPPAQPPHPVLRGRGPAARQAGRP